MMLNRKRYRWSGPQPTRGEERVANANPGFIDLAPVSEAPATQTRSNWSALLPDQTVPLIWEDRRYGRQEEC
jgi:hypothetical protein